MECIKAVVHVGHAERQGECCRLVGMKTDGTPVFQTRSLLRIVCKGFWLHPSGQSNTQGTVLVGLLTARCSFTPFMKTQWHLVAFAVKSESCE